MQKSTEKSQVIGNVRGSDYIKIVCASLGQTAFVNSALQKENLLLLGAGTNSIRLRPNLSVTPPEIELLLEKLDRLFEADRRTGPAAQQ